MTFNKNDLGKIALTGGSGFIGSYIAERLCQKAELKLLVRHETQSLTAETIYGDLNNPEAIIRLVSGTDTLVHLANSNFPRDKDYSLKDDIQNNLVATVNLFEKFAEINPSGHIVFFSSGGAIYEPRTDKIPFKEDDPIGPLSSYGIQKIAAEHFLKALCTRTGISATILRVSNPYGTILSPKRRQGIIGVAMACIRSNTPFNLFGEEQNVRDYLHLEDLYAVTEKVIYGQRTEATTNVYNVGSGTGISTKNLLDLIQEIAGSKLTISKTPATGLEPSWCVLDITRVSKTFEWKPTIDLKTGLELINRQN